ALVVGEVEREDRLVVRREADVLVGEDGIHLEDGRAAPAAGEAVLAGAVTGGEGEEEDRERAGSGSGQQATSEHGEHAKGRVGCGGERRSRYRPPVGPT